MNKYFMVPLVIVVLLVLSMSGCVDQEEPVIPDLPIGNWFVTPHVDDVYLNEYQQSTVVSVDIYGCNLGNGLYDVDVYVDILDPVNWGIDGKQVSTTVTGIGGVAHHTATIVFVYRGGADPLDQTETARITIKVFNQDVTEQNETPTEAFVTLRYLQRGDVGSPVDTYFLNVQNPNLYSYTVESTLYQNFSSSNEFEAYELVNGTYTIYYNDTSVDVLILGQDATVVLADAPEDTRGLISDDGVIIDTIESSIVCCCLVILIPVVLVIVLFWLLLRARAKGKTTKESKEAKE